MFTKKERATSKFKNHKTLHDTKKAVSETQNPKPPQHTHTHNYKHIKYKRRVKEKGTKILIKTSTTRQDSFILETGVRSSLIEYPI